MITTPAICRFRKLGCAVTAKVKIAPTAIRVRQLAVLICHSSDGGFRLGAVRAPTRIRGGHLCLTSAGRAPRPRCVAEARAPAFPHCGWCGIGMAFLLLP